MESRPALLLTCRPLIGYLSPFMRIAPHLDHSVRLTSFDTTTFRPAAGRGGDIIRGDLPLPSLYDESILTCRLVSGGRGALTQTGANSSVRRIRPR